ncbi:hypothetical protein AURDEDRAFT_142718 [Auricularia subglabra TFB-10046 SS5]|nr:hypothetical protein AURDEDRAFT_142718 [Auricularia subglabra TFB-10046 SS5]
MARVFKTLRRMVSWTRGEDSVPQLPKEAQDAPEQPLPPPPPPASKASKRKYNASDDEGAPDAQAKRPKADTPHADEAGETSAAAQKPVLEAEPEPEPAPSEPSETQSVSNDAEDEKENAPAATKDAEDEPKAAPDTPEPESKAEDEYRIPTLDEKGENIFVTWADGLMFLLDGMDAEAPVLFLKSQVFEAYKEFLTEGADPPADRDDSVGYWGVEVEEDARQTDLASKFVANWSKARTDPANKGVWWWELTVVRDEPTDETPRIKATLESSRHNEDHEIYGGKQLGDWWIVGLTPAPSDTDKLMTMHRGLY